MLDVPTKSALGLVTMLGLRGVGKQTAPKLARSYSSLASILDAPEAEIAEVVTKGAMQSIRDRSAWNAAHEKAHRCFDDAEKLGAKIVGLFDECYPPLLRRIPDPPPVIYLKGNLRPNCRNVACVGTRHPTWFGGEVARRMVKVLVAHDWSIVSGLAIGIDAESHRTALENGGHTVAIMANGLDSIYPKENRELAHAILDKGGAWISEQPPGTRAYAQHLVDRDRLQSGMSVGTFVMQTDIVGGTMHTVRFTLTQGRLLFAPVPPPAHAEEKQSQGIRAIAEQCGPTLADTIEASGEYRELLAKCFADRPPAIPIHGQGDYASAIDKLESALGRESP
jgi:DNA processing protein